MQKRKKKKMRENGENEIVRNKVTLYVSFPFARLDTSRVSTSCVRSCKQSVSCLLPGVLLGIPCYKPGETRRRELASKLRDSRDTNEQRDFPHRRSAARNLTRSLPLSALSRTLSRLSLLRSWLRDGVHAKIPDARQCQIVPQTSLVL